LETYLLHVDVMKTKTTNRWDKAVAIESQRGEYASIRSAWHFQQS
jgi:hypothetical protein